MRVGDMCTVKHHYGFTYTDDEMTIISIQYDSIMASGICVYVDALNYGVDSKLIVLLTDNKGKLITDNKLR